MEVQEMFNQTDALSVIHTTTSGLPLYSDMSREDGASTEPGTVRLTSQCLGIPQKIQRPFVTDNIHLAQLNVADGQIRPDASMLEWLQSKAEKPMLAVGFCELNGWQKPASDVEMMKNRPQIEFRAASAGFAHSHVMVNSQPYNIGIIAALPFEILGEYGPPTFQRGVLHVRFLLHSSFSNSSATNEKGNENEEDWDSDNSLLPPIELHLFVVHLHAHSSVQREKEAQSISSLVRPLLQDPAKLVVVMGDCNTLSPHDELVNMQFNIQKMLQRTDNQVFPRLKKKFLDASGAKINYRPMEILLESGLVDSCVEACMIAVNDGRDGKQGISEKYAKWKLGGDDSFSRCMTLKCRKTEPTLYNPEWPVLSDNLAHPDIRLDFILVSRSVSRLAFGSGDGGTFKASVDYAPEAQTHKMSDHYPMQAEWGVGKGRRVRLF